MMAIPQLIPTVPLMRRVSEAVYTTHEFMQVIVPKLKIKKTRSGV